MEPTNHDESSSRRTHPPVLGRVVIALLSFFCLACPVETDLADNGGMSGTGISSGPVTGFGSIFVNDVEWEIDGASVELDDDPGSPSDIRLGMVVRVEGTFSPGGDRGTARSVVYDDEIEGPLDDDASFINATMVEFTIFGRRVVAEEGVTYFGNGAVIDDLLQDDFVEVSGLIDQMGTIVATRIEARPGSDDVELKGIVQGLMPSINEFEIDGVTVVWDASTEFEDGLGSAADLANGQFVEVEGDLVSTNRIRAEEIELEDDPFGVDDADDVKLRGFVTVLNNNTDFEVSGVTVDARNAEFDPSGFMLRVGDFVEVEGALVGGVLIAEEVELEDLDDADGENVKIEAAVPVGGIGAFGPNTLRMLGVEVRVTAGTEMEDDRDGLPGFGFDDIEEGDWLEIEDS